MSEFYSSVVQATELPEYVDRKQAFHNLFEIWSQKAPIVADVLAGRYTFEQVVDPLVRENLRIHFPYFFNGACSSKEFEEQAKSINERLKDVLSIDDWVVMGRFPSYMHLGGLVRFPRFQFGMMFSIPVIVAAVLLALGWYNGVQINGMKFGLEVVLLFLKWGIIGGLGFATFQLLLSAPGYYSSRRGLARKVLAQAQFLDQTLSEARQS